MRTRRALMALLVVFAATGALTANPASTVRELGASEGGNETPTASSSHSEPTLLPKEDEPEADKPGNNADEANKGPLDYTPEVNKRLEMFAHSHWWS